MTRARCPFCFGECDDAASVCPVCNRDIAIPPTLLAERDELLRKRERLLGELAQARRKLKEHRRRLNTGDADASEN